MNVLFVLEYYPPHIGGVETVFKNLCQGLAQREHKVTVITSKLKGAKSFEVDNGVIIHRVRVPQRGARYWFTFLSIPLVLRYARKAEIIHTTTYNGAIPAWLASKLFNRKCIITVHEILGVMWQAFQGISSLSARLHRLFERLIISLSFNKFVSVSEYTKGSLKHLGVSDKKTTVIYNGIDQGLFNPNKMGNNKVRQQLNLEKEFIYIYYGRPGISKGVKYLVQAVPLILRQIPNAKLILLLAKEPEAGYGSIKKLIKELDIEKDVLLLDPVLRGELPYYIAASDCVVVPSLSEGFGFTAAEACAMEKPVVASNVASLPEIVSGKYILVEPGNPHAIADGIVRVYKNELEETSKKIFSWEDCVDRYLSVYQEVLDGK
jgi:glycosyltransferase involved in cell wall biosynthesis